jgi:uncharacterized protein
MAKRKKRLVFHVGGPAFHPVDKQAERVIEWLEDRYDYQIIEGAQAFEALDDCDLLVVMGLYWTGMSAEWAGNLEYQPMQEQHKQAYENYIASGYPVLAHHGAIASYDDWPRFGELLGFSWIWGTTAHSPLGDYWVHVLPTGHPIVIGVHDYIVHDELYYNVKTTPGLALAVHAEAEWKSNRLPMIITAEGGRIKGAGRTAYLANGHDMRAFEAPALKQIWINTINWLLGDA